MQCSHLDTFFQVHQAKAMLELIQDASAVMAKVEGLVGELPPADQPPSARDFAAHAKHAERTASELSRLHFYMSKGSTLPLVIALKPRADSAAARLSGALLAALAVVLPLTSGEAETAARRCIHSCGLVGDIALAHEAVRAVLLRPALAHAASAAGGGDRDAAAASLLAPFLDAAKAELQPLLKRQSAMVVERPDLAPSFDLLGDCVLAETHAAIKEHLPSAFSSAAPVSFHANFTAATEFLRWLEGHAASKAALQLLRGGAARAAFTKEWSLPVYYSLVFQEVARGFEQCLNFGPRPAPASRFQRVAFEQSQELLKALSRCRDPGVTFPAVYERFFKLQLQLVLRYAAWIGEVTGAREVRQRAADAGADATVSADQDFSGFDAGSMRAWAKAASPQQVVQLLGEACTVAGILRGDEASAATQQLAPLASEAAMQQVPQVRISHFTNYGCKHNRPPVTGVWGIVQPCMCLCCTRTTHQPLYLLVPSHNKCAIAGIRARRASNRTEPGSNRGVARRPNTRRRQAGAAARAQHCGHIPHGHQACAGERVALRQLAPAQCRGAPAAAQHQRSVNESLMCSPRPTSGYLMSCLCDSMAAKHEFAVYCSTAFAMRRWQERLVQRAACDRCAGAVQAAKGYPEWPALTETLRQRLLHASVAAIVGSFKGACEELLDSVAKMQASLSKFRRATPGSAGAAQDGGLTSLAKIQKQLQLDVAEFGRQIERVLGGAAGDVGEFSELRAVVHRALEDGAAAAAEQPAGAPVQQPPADQNGTSEVAGGSQLPAKANGA
jgi:Domain of unknown function (DUF3510)